MALLSTPGVLVAQDFQFMAFPTRARTSVLPAGPVFRGYAAGGDLDGDGRSDLVTTFGSTGTNISFAAGVYLHRANGWQLASQLSRTAQRPTVLDLDGDGDRDVALTPPDLSTPCPVLLYEQRAGQLLAVPLPAAMTGAGAAVQGVALGDIDGDGIKDMIVAPIASAPYPPIVLVRGSVGLQFTVDLTATPAGTSLGLWPTLIDADGDGDLDVLASNATSGLRLLRNVGGTFVDHTAALPPGRTGHTFLLTADLDGDGRDDCAAILANGDVDVLWGVPGGLLAFASGVASVPGVRSLIPADFDGDGDLDLLAEGPNGLDVLWNLGGRRFSREVVLRDAVTMVGAADFDANGMADVLFTVAGAETIMRCKYGARIEDAAFLVGPPTFGTNLYAAPCAGDIDGDGRTDFVTPGWPDIKVDHALGGGRYQRTTSPSSLSDNGGMWRSLLADMDNDGDLDLVVRSDARLAIATNDGAGAFSWLMSRPQTSGRVDDLRVADIDGDGDRDIVQSDSSGLSLTRNLGNGQFALPIVFVPPATAPHAIELADVDGDGDLDLVTDVVARGLHVIFANDGQGQFAANPAFHLALGSVAPFSMRAADLNGDGDQDLVTVGQGLRVFRNDGRGSFADRTTSDLPALIGSPVSNAVAADLDEDGDIDLALLFNDAQPRMLLLFNDGTGRFVDMSAARCQPVNPVFFTPIGYASLQAADIDDDRDVDLVAANHATGTILVDTLRQCRSNVAPRPGGIASIDLLSGPGFGSTGAALLGVGFAPAAPPLPIPGVAGQLDLEPSTLQILATVQTGPVGASTAFVPVPALPALFGMEVWFQGAILQSTGRHGLTNSVYEVVLR